MTDAALVAIAAAVIGISGWRVSLRLWPNAPCRRCGGNGRNWGSTGKRSGRCGKCGGSGRRQRFGVREPRKRR